jgi:hypothetical protein
MVVPTVHMRREFAPRKTFVTRGLFSRLAAVAKRALRGARRTNPARLEMLAEDAKYDLGFHGDEHVVGLASAAISRSQAFIETGSFAGSTAVFVGSNFLVPVYTCEPDPVAYQYVRGRCRHLKRVCVSHKQSPDFLYELFAANPAMKNMRLVFWLDAHGQGFRWPLGDEVRFITENVSNAIIMIDDFKIPGRPEFGYDRRGDEECGLEYVSRFLSSKRSYTLFLPSYSRCTSPYHALRGVGTLVYGEALVLTQPLACNFTITSHRVPSRSEVDNDSSLCP